MSGSGGKVQVGIGLGSNLGDSQAILQAAWQRLGEEGLGLHHLSSPYTSAPLDMESEHDFVNAVGVAETGLPPVDVLALLLRIEQEFGRVRSGPGHQDRTLDLDLLWYGQSVMATAELVIPHPELAHRLFVLAPLAEVVPDWHHPLTGETPAAMQRALVARVLSGATPQQQIKKQQWSGQSAP